MPTSAHVEGSQRDSGVISGGEPIHSGHATDRKSRPRLLYNPGPRRPLSASEPLERRTHENPSTRSVRRCVDEVNISPGPGAFRAQRDRQTPRLNTPGPGEDGLKAARHCREDPG